MIEKHMKRRKKHRPNRVKEYILDLLYPSRCILCRNFIGPGGPRICGECMQMFSEHFDDADLHSEADYLSGCVSAGSYEGKLRQTLIRYKFGGQRIYADALGELLAAAIYRDETLRFDMISWVPVSKDRLRKRGYDQAELLARAAAERLMVPAVPTLKKKNGVKAQSEQTDRQARKENIRGCYQVLDPARIEDKTILLIDDIITTGSTMSEGAKTLMMAGADTIFGATVARRTLQGE